jgi:butyrate kinase
MKVLVINPGATSTKIAVFDEDRRIFDASVNHSAAELAPFEHVVDQVDFRRNRIMDELKKGGIRLADMDAVCGRGGLLHHIPSGTYRVDDAVIHDILHPFYGEHAASLGPWLAKQLADSVGIPAFFVDPVSVDELTDMARVSGFKGMERESFFHALNQKSMARRAAEQIHRPYEDVNLIVIHMGGGVSVAAHCRGRVIDNFNVKDDGSMGMDRGGSLPVNAVVKLCYSGKTFEQVRKMLGSEAGVYSYLGTKDFREVEQRAFSGSDSEAQLIFRAFAYQLAKDAGAMAAVLKFQVDAVVLTGGIAYSDRFCAELTQYLQKLAPIIRIPGEEEMRSLAEGALRVLHGGKCRNYSDYAGGREK